MAWCGELKQANCQNINCQCHKSPKPPNIPSTNTYFWLHGMVWCSQQYCLFPHTATKPPSVVTETSTPIYLLHPSNGSQPTVLPLPSHSHQTTFCCDRNQTIGSVEDERTPHYNKYRHRWVPAWCQHILYTSIYVNHTHDRTSITQHNSS
jgi:hypothetical protein